ncbi:uncharacterized protein LOC134181840 isoform X1 [Corticium candelabrum]|uniref:uncharacterized protein LOC134181840 isoform X1 n=1 Tax=Corticium candelabrum TaxID=121492 RepID=UPI002E25B3EF|nr:uncharacterized protein LOC134181840 isoform X1 [Corticium candelabrum]
MWQYLWVHCVYHLARWFPRNDRRKIRLLLFFFSSALLVPLFIVLLLDQSTRYCSGNLFNLCVASICFTVCMIGFSFLFTLMDPVPWQVRLVFHVYGLGTAILGVLLLQGVLDGQEDCASFVPALYYVSLAYAVLSTLSMAIFVILIPLWLINHFKKNSLLDRQHKEGCCYEPVRVCSCLWHV